MWKMSLICKLIGLGLTKHECWQGFCLSKPYMSERPVSALVYTVVPPLRTGRATTVFEEPESLKASKRYRRVRSNISIRSAGYVLLAESLL